MVNTVENSGTKTAPQRLCSEIQLFDLCELERCDYKDGRFCTDPRLLTKFEAIADEDERPAPARPAPDVDDADEEDEFFDDTEEEEDEDGYSVFDDEDKEEQDWER